MLASHSRRPASPLENKENESLRMGSARRIGSGRIIAARAFEREARAEKERERERDLKDKRFRVGVFQVICLMWGSGGVASFANYVMSFPPPTREILVTNVYLVRGGEMTPMLKKNQSGFLEVQQASLKRLSSLDLMTKFWKMTSAGRRGQGSEQSL